MVDVTTISLGCYVPTVNRIEYCSIPYPVEYNVLYYSVTDDLDLVSGVKVSMSLRDNQGWNIEIVDDGSFAQLAQFAHGCYTTASKIAADDIIALTFSTSILGPRRRILHLHYKICSQCFRNSNIIHGFNIRKLQELFSHSSGLKFIGYRTVLSNGNNMNDGNSYYRAVYFSLFEQLIISSRNALFDSILRLFTEFGYDDKSSSLSEDFEELLVTLKLAAGKLWCTAVYLRLIFV